MNKANRVDLSELTKQVTFLDTYGFQITNEYVHMLLEQVCIREWDCNEMERSRDEISHKYTAYQAKIISERNVKEERKG